MLALAGLWTRPNADEPATAAILTTGPNPLMEGLHHRMPVVLGAGDWQTWLAADAQLDDLLPLLISAAEDALTVWPVGTAVNRVGTDGPALLRPLDVIPAHLGLA